VRTALKLIALAVWTAIAFAVGGATIESRNWQAAFTSGFTQGVRACEMRR
jgi:hypothetical protein